MKFTKDHEWVKMEGDVGTVGITDFAQNALGDIVYVELPEKGRKVQQGNEVAVVESVKTASDIYAPIAGEIVAINDKLKDDPSLINSSAEANGWFFKIKPSNPADINALMDAAAYKKHTGG